jgi:hypothetical protein
MRGLEFLAIALGVGLVPSAGALTVRWHHQEEWRRSLVAYTLSFPRGLDIAAVTTFVAGLSGLVARRHHRPFVARAVIFETTATSEGIAHHLLVPPNVAPTVLSALRAALPGVGARPDDSYRLRQPTAVAEVALSDHARPLAIKRAEALSTALLSSLQPLDKGEAITVQWSASPTGPVEVVSKEQVKAGSALRQLLGSVPPSEPDPEAIQAARDKQAHPLFVATGRVGVTASNRAHARMVLGRVIAALHLANAPGVHLRRRWLPSAVVARRLARRRLSLITMPCVLNGMELAALLAFPLGDVSLPGLRIGGCRQLAPSSDIPAGGRVVAQATFPGAERPLALSIPDSLKHLHIIGPTGVGKSTLLLNLIAQDMAAGRGVVVLDPKGDLVRDVLDRVPEHRVGDVIVLDPTDEERPVGLNLLSGSGEAPELVVDQIVGIFANLFKSNWGPRTDDVLRSALLTLAGVPGATLVEVPLLLADTEVRRRLVGRVDNPVLRQFWGWYNGLSAGERSQVIAPLSNKLRAVLLRRRLRNVLGQAEPRLDLDAALAQQKILLVPLTKGLLGEEAAALAGSLVVARVWQAVQRRTAMAPTDRPLTFAYIDEFQDYLHLPMGVADVLAQARGLGLGLALAHQHLGQLPPALREAVLANARSRVIFQVSSGELAPYLTAADLQGLAAYEVAMTLSAGARVVPPVTAATTLPPEVTGMGERARQQSRETYGIDRAEVEAAIHARHEGRPGTGDVGRGQVRS